MKRYMITGGTGYIGSMLAEELLTQSDTEVTVIVREPKRLNSAIRDNVKIIRADITDRKAVLQIDGAYDYLIHCAAPTRSSFMISHPVDTAEAIVDGTRNMLELSRKCHVGSMVYLSSMEVYGNIDCTDGRRVSEDELGELDISNVRSCYPMAKRMAESFCHLYYDQYGVPVKIARLAQTFGRGVSPDDNRVFAQFGQAVRNQTDIVLHTRGTSMGNYCDIDDVVDAVLFLLEKGEAAQAYNIVNEDNTMTIREMAELVAARIAQGKIRVTYDIPDDNRFGYAAPTGLRLSGAKMKALGWEARTGLEEMYRRSICQ